MTDTTASQTDAGKCGAAAGESKNTILIAVDGSEHSFYALDWYLAHMHKPGSKVVIVHCSDYKDLIWTPVMSTDSQALSNMIHIFEEETNSTFEQIEKRLSMKKVDAKLVRMSGNSGSAIVKAAKDHNVDYIVAGSRGLGKLRRTFVGSVSSYILHHAHCPVLICQNKNQ